jgi:hypothetical protein
MICILMNGGYREKRGTIIMTKRNGQMKPDGKKTTQAGSWASITTPRFWKTMVVIGILIVGGGVLFFTRPANHTGAVEMIVYKSSTCKCCDKWVAQMRDAGFKVTTREGNDMDSIKSSYGIMPGLRSCHTAVVEGYVVEGHVPAGDIKRLLQERPAIAGLAVPGMPMGSPGMEGQYQDPYDVLAFDVDGRAAVYARY